MKRSYIHLLIICATTVCIGTNSVVARPSGRINTSPRFFGQPYFSPDGKYLALTMRYPLGRGGPLAEMVVLSAPDWKLVELEPLPDDDLHPQCEPSWSPDSSRILNVRSGELWTWNVEDHFWKKPFELITKNHSLPGSLPLAKWSPIGESIIFWDARSKRSVVADEQRNITPVSVSQFRSTSYHGFEWCPDGSAFWVAVADDYYDSGLSDQAGDPNDGIYRVALDGSKPELLSRVGQVKRVVLSPDGNTLAAVNGGNSGCMRRASQVDLIDVHSGKRTHVDKSSFFYPVAWSPEGDKLAYSTSKGPMVYLLETKQKSELNAGDLGVHWVSFHPKTSSIWGTSDDAIYELVGEEWIARVRLQPILDNLTKEKTPKD